MTTSSIARFWSKVKKTKKSCWNWTSGKGHFGHGRFAVTHAITKYAHRISYELVNGPIPDGMCILHKCDNPSCVRPDHLFLGTKTDNALDRDTKNRTGRSPGENNGNSKITEKQVKEIFKLRNIKNLFQREIGELYGLSQSQVGRILRRERWTHL